MFKNIVLGLLILLNQNAFALNCKSFDHDTKDMNACAYKEYLDSDKKLNIVFKKILNKYKDYPAALENSKHAEKSWIRFRDAQLKMKFPPLKKGHSYGSINPILKSWYLEKLTKERIKELTEILNDDYVDKLNE